ncbi:MAG: hypothetical protein M3Z00_05615 [Actinomycetota bacterium]|nr:hypothetical protein [Actinomycetota bacterium]
MSDTDGSLRIQLLPLALISEGATDTVRAAGGDLVSRLVRRTAAGVVPVTRDESASHRGSDPFAVAAEQTFTHELVGADVRDHVAAGVTFRMIAVDGSPFTTTALLWPDTVAKFHGMVDAIVSAPRMSAVLVRPVLTQGDIGAARTLRSVAQVVFRDAPDPCTDEVYWWHAGQIFRVEFDRSTVGPVLPPELSQLVAALPG